SSAGTIGFRVGMTDQSGSTSWNYSDYGRTVTETRSISGVSGSFAFTTVSDWLGRIASLTYPDSEVVSYAYDALGRVNAMSGSEAGNLASLAYNALSQITQMSLGNGVLVTNTYSGSTNRLLN